MKTSIWAVTTTMTIQMVMISGRGLSGVGIFLSIMTNNFGRVAFGGLLARPSSAPARAAVIVASTKEAGVELAVTHKLRPSQEQGHPCGRGRCGLRGQECMPSEQFSYAGEGGYREISRSWEKPY